MKAPPAKRGRAPLKNDAGPASFKLSKTTPEQETVQQFQTVLAKVDRLPTLAARGLTFWTA
jgi:hypothetical protein